MPKSDATLRREEQRRARAAAELKANIAKRKQQQREQSVDGKDQSGPEIAIVGEIAGEIAGEIVGDVGAANRIASG